MRKLAVLFVLQLVGCSNEYPDKVEDLAASGAPGTERGGGSGDASVAAKGGSNPSGSGGVNSPSSATSGMSSPGVGGNSVGIAGASGSAVAGATSSAAAAGAGAIPGTGWMLDDKTRWVGSWAAAQQLTEPSNQPPSPGLSNNTLRQIFQVSIGGSRLRLRFSNEFGSSPVTLNAVHCAKSAGGASIDAATGTAVTFKGLPSITIPAQQAVFSDGFDLALSPLSRLAVSIYFGQTSKDITGHPGSRTTSYLQGGNVASAVGLSTASKTEHWYILSGLDVAADEVTKAVAILGDSLTDGRGSTTNEHNRWPDALAKRLQANPATVKVGVLNQGIGGNAVLSGGLGPTALKRFDADVVGQRGVRWGIVFEGVNDIGYSSSATIASGLITAYTQLIAKGHAQGLLVYGATITPFGQHSYYTTAREEARQAVNQWIRAAGNFDAVLDFDAAVRDATTAINLAAAYSSDGLHMTPSGYQKLADSIDLTLFTR